MRRRAQTSIEFIIILAAVVGILVLVLSITDSFPDIGHSFKDRHYTTFWEIQDIGILNSFFDSSGGKLFLINNMNDVITINSVDFDSVSESFSYSLDPGETILVNLSLETTGYYSKNLIINYTNEVNGFNYSVFGGFPLEGIANFIPYSPCEYQVSCGDSIDVFGGYYCLSGNVDNYVGTCFTVAEDNLTLDGNGYYIDGDDVGTDYGVTISSRENITVTNFETISDFYDGILTASSPKTVVYDVLAESNANAGFNFGSANFIENNSAYNNTNYGFYVAHTSEGGVTYQNNIAIDNNDGFYLTSSSFLNELYYNTASYNNNQGFHVSGGDSNVFYYNYAYSNTQSGYYVDDAADSNSFYYNNASSNGNNGFDNFGSVGDSNYTNYNSNIALANGGYGFYVEGVGTDVYVDSNSAINQTGSYGFSFSGHTGSTFENNIAEGNLYGYGIYGSYYSYAIEYNTADSNTYKGFYVQADNSDFGYNNATNNEDGFFIDGNNNNFNDNTATSNSNYGLYLTSSSNTNTFSSDYACSNSVYDLYCNSSSVSNSGSSLTLGNGYVTSCSDNSWPVYSTDYSYCS